MVATSSIMSSPTATVQAPPRLYTSGWFRNLFVAELWERFAFFGIQAILVLYAVAPTSQGGLGLSAGSAAATFGAFIGVMFMLALPGGWFADRVLGQQRSLVIGQSLIALGCFTIALTGPVPTMLGLLSVACGFGLFKPNHQALVNMLAGRAGRREATIAALFVGIQSVGLVAPLIVGSLGERVSWRVAFATIGLALGIGAAATAAGLRSFGTAGAHRARPLAAAETQALLRRLVPAGVVLVVLLGLGLATGFLTPKRALMLIGLSLIAVPWVGYRRLKRSVRAATGDSTRVPIMLVLMLAAAVFWLLAGQDGSVLTLFAKESTDRTVLGFTIPASWLQGATPFFMLLLAPLLAWQLPRLGSRFSVPAKFAFGLILAGGSFLVMTVASSLAADGTRVSPFWLLGVYLMHAFGEIVIAAVSISSIADLVPRSYLGQAIGVYWLFAALGGGLSSQVAALIDVVSGPVYYSSLGIVALLVGTAFIVFRRRLDAPFSTHAGAITLRPIAEPAVAQ